MRRLLILLLSFALLSASDFLPLSKIKPGLKGYGLSVFKGETPQRFDVEIMGVLKNIAPETSLIIAKLSGAPLDKAGVMAGMSGSPVFVQDKLVGAIAYAFPYAKEAIAGIVPIEEILAAGSAPSGSFSSALRWPFPKRMDFRKLLDRLLEGGVPSGLAGFVRLPLPVSINFAESKALSMLLERAHLLATPLTFSSSLKPEVKLESLSPGDAVAIMLTTGDIEFPVGGTVVYTDKRKGKVYIFGHPFLNLGFTEYALAKAEVIGYVPSLQNSFKLMQPTKLVGRVVEDREKGVVGELGKAPDFIPVELNFSSPKREKKYHFSISPDPMLAPVLLMISAEELLRAHSRLYGELTLKVEGEFYIKNYRNVKFSDVFVGTSSSDVIGLDAAILYYLLNNPYRRAKIEKVKLKYTVYEYDRSARLVKAWVPKYKVKPGERLPVTVTVQPKNEKPESRTYELTVPEVPRGVDLYLLIGSANDIIAWERRYYRAAAFFPDSFERLIRALNNLRKNHYLYFKFFTVTRSLVLKGEEYSAIPPSYSRLFTSPYSSTRGVQTIISTIVEYTASFPYYLSGSVLIKLKTES